MGVQGLEAVMDSDTHLHDRVDHFLGIWHVVGLIDKDLIHPVHPDLVDDICLFSHRRNAADRLTAAFLIHKVNAGDLVVVKIVVHKVPDDFTRQRGRGRQHKGSSALLDFGGMKDPLFVQKPHEE